MDNDEKKIESVVFKPIGYASTWFKFKNATPRQPSVSALTRGSIKISTEVFSQPQHSLKNLAEFSHVWIIFLFHKNGRPFTKTMVAPPRLGGARVGLFSTRSPHRPNPIGLTLAKLEKVEGDTIHLCGLDLLDGTPIIDIKPYITSYDHPQDIEKNDSDESHPDSASVPPTTISNPEWITLGSSEKTLNVAFTQDALSQIRQFSPDAEDPAYRLSFLKSPEEAQKAIEDILREDPRSIYRKMKGQDLLYFCVVDCMHVTTWFDEVIKKCEVLRVMPYSARQAMIEANKKQQWDNNLAKIEDKMKVM
ncbi:tRNA (adenine(37)-N6)-methyltransferase-like [Daphnia carinata]|uniref:tRNA (adenine(37)-N6)-methyltransferase-like n=1 Tax=Daphnia carinata TaxID=120202 RepID=UPI00257BBDBD|nr:tRNA (adenine(37)-N6)-methyltransferase-like [Daphnia carinata]